MIGDKTQLTPMAAWIVFTLLVMAFASRQSRIKAYSELQKENADLRDQLAKTKAELSATIYELRGLKEVNTTAN